MLAGQHQALFNQVLNCFNRNGLEVPASLNDAFDDLVDHQDDALGFTGLVTFGVDEGFHYRFFDFVTAEGDAGAIALDDCDHWIAFGWWPVRGPC
ncbi:hypothetical protein D3C86_1886040 [compost metagenome]